MSLATCIFNYHRSQLHRSHDLEIEQDPSCFFYTAWISRFHRDRTLLWCLDVYFNHSRIFGDHPKLQILEWQIFSDLLESLIFFFFNLYYIFSMRSVKLEIFDPGSLRFKEMLKWKTEFFEILWNCEIYVLCVMNGNCIDCNFITRVRLSDLRTIYRYKLPIYVYTLRSAISLTWHFALERHIQYKIERCYNFTCALLCHKIYNEILCTNEIWVLLFCKRYVLRNVYNLGFIVSSQTTYNIYKIYKIIIW